MQNSLNLLTTTLLHYSLSGFIEVLALSWKKQILTKRQIMTQCYSFGLFCWHIPLKRVITCPSSGHFLYQIESSLRFPRKKDHDANNFDAVFICVIFRGNCKYCKTHLNTLSVPAKISIRLTNMATLLPPYSSELYDK